MQFLWAEINFRKDAEEHEKQRPKRTNQTNSDSDPRSCAMGSMPGWLLHRAVERQGLIRWTWPVIRRAKT